MKLAKRHKLYAAVLGLAATVAVVTDAPSDEEPVAPSAKETAKAKKSKTDSKKDSKDAADAPVETHLPPACDVLAERLKELCGARGVKIADARDVFGPTEGWFSGPKQETTTEPVSDGIRAFREKYRLKATVVSSGGVRAIINDKCLAIGMELDGFSLVSVTRLTAVLESATARVVLRIAPPGQTPSMD